jgi:transcriptional regulator with XRE-family HTH domain
MPRKAGKTITSDRIGTEATTDSPVPILEAGIGTRIAQAADRLKSRADAAMAMGVSPAALQRYIKEQNMPPFDAVVRLCAATGIRLEWIASGKGEEISRLADSQPLRASAERLGQAIYVLDGVLAQMGATMESADKAETLLMLIEYIGEGGGALTPNNVVSLMDHVSRRKRQHESRQPDPANRP